MCYQENGNKGFEKPLEKHKCFYVVHIVFFRYHADKLITEDIGNDKPRNGSDELLNNLDYAIISMHRQNYRSGSVSQNTEAYINAIKHPAVKILGHCDDTHFPVDYETLARAALRENVIFEINEAPLAPGGYRGDTRANAARILYLCQKYQLPVILSSDSHGKEHVGDFTYAEEFVHQLMFPETLILNNQLPKLKVFLQTR